MILKTVKKNKYMFEPINHEMENQKKTLGTCILDRSCLRIRTYLPLNQRYYQLITNI